VKYRTECIKRKTVMCLREGLNLLILARFNILINNYTAFIV